MNRRVRNMAIIYPLFPKDAQTKIFPFTVRLWIWLWGQIVSSENKAMMNLWQRKERIEKSELVGLWWYLMVSFWPVLPCLNAPLYCSFLPPWPSILFSLLQPTPCSNPPTRELLEGDFFKPLWRWISPLYGSPEGKKKIATFHPCLSQHTQGERDQHLPDICLPTGSSSPVGKHPLRNCINPDTLESWPSAWVIFSFGEGWSVSTLPLLLDFNALVRAIYSSPSFMRCSLWNSEVSLILKTYIAIAECSLFLTYLYFTGNLRSSNKKKRPMLLFLFCCGILSKPLYYRIEKRVRFPLTQAFYSSLILMIHTKGQFFCVIRLDRA